MKELICISIRKDVLLSHVCLCVCCRNAKLWRRGKLWSDQHWCSGSLEQPGLFSGSALHLQETPKRHTRPLHHRYVCSVWMHICGLWFTNKFTQRCYHCLHLYFKWLNMLWFISEVNLVRPSHAIWVYWPKIACFLHALEILVWILLIYLKVCFDLKISPVSVCETDSWADDGRYQCDVGWQNFQAGCYRLNSDNLEWSSAHKTCQKMEANLVSIHTLPELEFITKHMKKGIDMLMSIYKYTEIFFISILVFSVKTRNCLFCWA